MGYQHIDNLYKFQDILLFGECYATEKVHGTSAHVEWKDGTLLFFAGGAKHDEFVSLFDADDLRCRFAALGHDAVTVYGEAYGGKMQGMSATYGKRLLFIAFEAKVGDKWLDVPNAEKVALALGLEFVPYVRIPTTLAAIDAERDRPSVVAERRGCGTDKAREGVVLRPIVEVTKNNGQRIMAKHKGDAFNERATPQRVVDPSKLERMHGADGIAHEWVTPMRLTHVLDAFPDAGMERMGDIIKAMQADIAREAEGEVELSREALKAIGTRTVGLFKARLVEALAEAA